MMATQHPKDMTHQLWKKVKVELLKVLVIRLLDLVEEEQRQVKEKDIEELEKDEIGMYYDSKKFTVGSDKKFYVNRSRKWKNIRH